MKILMCCGTVSEKRLELDKGKEYEVGSDVSEKEASRLVFLGLACYVTETEAAPDPEAKAKKK